jgi:serine/threonine protein kinase/WD40 repeat protein
VSLSPGHRLGPYLVVGELGSGGMGEVYRARDERLGREVAVKVLPRDVAADPERRQRFEREARAVAALSHPAVLALYDVGEADGLDFMVTELLAGETLRERLRRGALEWERVAEWGASVADALAVAHVRGIVHRDVKPENLFLTRDGRVKVLDFGLARELSLGAGGGDDDPTLPSPTRAGTVLGTVGYLSPEQARGEPVDSRSDVFSLGCVLYEGLYGRRPFSGATAQDVIAALLRDAPAEAGAGGAAVPPALARVVARCLAKDRAERFQSASDLAFALRSVALLRSEAPAAFVKTRRRPLGAALLVLGVAIGAFAAGRWRSPVGPPAEPLVLSLTPGMRMESSPTISADGKFVAYLASEGGRTDVWVKFIGGGPPVNVTAGSGLEIQSRADVGGLEISPDGALIGVRAGPPGQPTTAQGVWLFPAPLGGPPRKLVDRAAGLRFSPDGQRVAFMRPDPALGDAIVVAERDGADERVIVSPRPGVHAHEPAWSPDGRWLYFDRSTSPNSEAPIAIWRAPSAGGPAEPVVETSGIARAPLPTPDGRGLLYSGDQAGGALNLWWRPLGGGRERRLTSGIGEYVSPRVSLDGRRLVCEARTSVGSLRELDLRVAHEAVGRVLAAAGGDDAVPSVSKSGRIAFSSARNGAADIWTSDRDGANPRPLTSDPEIDSLPAISPDGTQVAFVSDRGGRRGLWIGAADGGAPRLVVHAEIVDPPSWSPDGQRLVYAAGSGLSIVSAKGGQAAIVPGASGRLPVWSPAGDAIAFFTSTPEGLRVRFVTPTGGRLPDRPEIATGPLVAMAFSWDGRSLAMGISPGTAEAQIIAVDLGTGQAKILLRAGPFNALRGLAFMPEDARLLYGLLEHQSRVLLFDGLGAY